MISKKCWILSDERERRVGWCGGARGRHRKRILTLILWWSGPTCCKLRVLVVSTNEVPGEPSRLEQLHFYHIHSRIYCLNNFHLAPCRCCSRKVYDLPVCRLMIFSFPVLIKVKHVVCKMKTILQINCQHLREASPSAWRKQKWLVSHQTTLRRTSVRMSNPNIAFF